MITEHDLQEAIAECQGQRNPTASTCIKLAAYLTIKNSLYPGDQPEQGYSFKAMPVKEVISYQSDSDFGKAVQGRNASDVMPVMDELMDTLRIIHPRLYNGVMGKL